MKAKAFLVIENIVLKQALAYTRMKRDRLHARLNDKLVPAILVNTKDNTVFELRQVIADLQEQIKALKENKKLKVML